MTKRLILKQMGPPFRGLSPSKSIEAWCHTVIDCHAMSAIVAVNWNGDIIVCSEGKETWERPSIPGLFSGARLCGRDDCLKSIALNSHVCLAMAGSSVGIYVLAHRLLPDCGLDERDRSPAFNYLEGISGPLTSMSLFEARDKILEIMNEARAKDDLGSRELVRSHVFIGGTEDRIPLLYGCIADRGVFTAEIAELLWAPPPSRYFTPSMEFPTPDDVVKKVVSKNYYDFSQMEERCAKAIEEYARHSETCNDRVMFRRLSRGFILESKEDVLAH